MTDIHNNQSSSTTNSYAYTSARYNCTHCNRQFSQLKVDPNATQAQCPRCNMYCYEVPAARPAPQQSTYSSSGSSQPYNQQNTQQNQQQRQPEARQQQANPGYFLMRDQFGRIFVCTEVPVVQPQPQAGFFDMFTGLNPGFFFTTTGGMYDEALIEEFLRNDPNNYGPAPASKEAINNLKEVSFDCCASNGDSTCCSVCYEDYKQDEKLVQLPCQHRYHKDCVSTWLNQHNSCPMCRAQI